MVIEPAEAEVIKRIFKEYLNGGSLIKIAKGLESDGILTGAGKKRWTGNTVKGILENEKYMGDALLAKTYTVDFLSKKRVKNDGIVPQYYVENSHEAIIPKPIFLQVQEELSRRSKLKKQKGAMNYSAKYALSGICFCSHCGDTYRRIHWANMGNKIIVWRCHKCLEKNQTCDSRTIKEDILKKAVVKAIQDVFIDSDKIKEMLTKSINKILSSENYDEITFIDTKLEEMQEKLITFSTQSSEVKDIGEQILILKEQKQQLLLNSANKDTSTQRMEEMIKFLDSQKLNNIEYDEIMVRRLVEKITIYDEHISIKFKSGIEIVVEE